MWRCVLMLACSSVLTLPSIAQDARTTSSQTSGSRQADENTGKVPDKQSDSAAQPADKPNPVTNKLRKLLPECVNIIFSTCKGNASREIEAQQREEERLAHAAERCAKLQAALPASLRPTTTTSKSTTISPQESSSRSASSPEIHPYCTPEDVLAAEHDVEVGDFYFKDKALKSAEMRYRSALERLPGEPMASLRLARMLEKTGRGAEALTYYRTFMEWSPTGKEAEEAQTSIRRLSSSAQK
ncbi:MAG TPA: hypothetical protein VN577_05710 [Terriglobales bacterium]|nr:hypothetical protein [Terriglobales bacterium]